ncbi:MAG: hypothetical protein R3D85_01955 [Paracoccaceae bacterium]
MPGIYGVAGYVAAIAVLTPGYRLFQAANNTAVMAGPDSVAARCRVCWSCPRNLGLIFGATAMGAMFAVAVGATTMAAATPQAITGGIGPVFALAGAMMLAAFGLTRRRAG